LNKKINLLVVMAMLSVAAFACSPATPTSPSSTVSGGLPQTEADVPRISVEEAAAALQSGEAVVLDVRSTEAFQASHIPGAFSIPLDEIESNPTGLNLDKDEWIITYCT
jgi:3-mercaptopyruvate sulfurtransferase SseA